MHAVRGRIARAGLVSAGQHQCGLRLNVHVAFVELGETDQLSCYDWSDVAAVEDLFAGARTHWMIARRTQTSFRQIDYAAAKNRDAQGVQEE